MILGFGFGVSIRQKLFVQTRRSFQTSLSREHPPERPLPEINPESPIPRN